MTATNASQPNFDSGTLPETAPTQLKLHHPATRRAHTRRLLSEILLVYFFTVGVTKIFYELRGLNIFTQYAWTAAMLLQVYVPAWLLHRHDLTIAHFGLHTRRWPRSLLWASGLFLIIFIPSAIGHHYWQMYLGRDLRQEISFRRLPAWLQDEPTTPPPAHVIQVFHPKRERGVVVVRWQQPFVGTLKSDGMLQAVGGMPFIEGPTHAHTLRINARRTNATHEVRFVMKGNSLNLRFQRQRQLIPTKHIRFGKTQRVLRAPAFSKDLFWLLELILIQLLMVALPEEFFYRGYMLTRMDAIWPVRRVWGIPLSWGNLVTSILFAITHVVFGYQPYRLSVFFPSLLFGALRQHTGSLLAPILLHAASNLLMRLLEIAYL